MNLGLVEPPDTENLSPSGKDNRRNNSKDARDIIDSWGRGINLTKLMCKLNYNLILAWKKP